MAFCTQCGSVAEGQFCPKCGASIAGAPPAQTMTGAPGLTQNAAAALCYLFGMITGIVFLVMAPYNQQRRVRFHAFQSILLNVALVVVHIGITILSLMFHAFSFTLGLMVGALHLLVSLGFFLVWLYMMWNTYQGGDTHLPVIGALAASQAGTDSPSAGTMGRAA